jgi:hypothetical protein
MCFEYSTLAPIAATVSTNVSDQELLFASVMLKEKVIWRPGGQDEEIETRKQSASLAE